MQIKFVHYKLRDGYIDNWLAAGPQSIQIEEEIAGRDSLQEAAKTFFEEDSGITELPVERGSVTDGVFTIGDYTGSWDYYACQEDHWIDQTDHYPFYTYLRSWAYAHIYSKADQPAILQIFTFGPLDVWIDGEHLFRQDHFADQPTSGKPLKIALQVTLQKGINKLLLRFENVAVGDCIHAVSVQVLKPETQTEPAGVQVRIPTLIKTIGRRNLLERVFKNLYLDQDVYSQDQSINLHWPTSQKEEFAYAAVRLVHASNRIYAEAEVDGTPGDQLFLGFPAQIPGGLYHVNLSPKFWELYEQGFRLFHRIPLWNLSWRRSSEVEYGTIDSRKQEALKYAARSEQQGGIYREIALMALGEWEQIESNTIFSSLQQVRQRLDGSVLDVLGLLGMVFRFREQEHFPAGLLGDLETSLLDYRYQETDTGWDAMDFLSESRDFLFAVCQILAGQRYPKQTFPRSQLSGKELQQHGEQRALEWLHKRAAFGFETWGSPESFAEILAGLSHLVDWAEAEPVWQLAGVVMDKLFFTIALNSFKGVYGGSACKINPWTVKGGLYSALSGITRLMWGQGVFSTYLPGEVSLACSDNYEMPILFSTIANSPLAEEWNCERHTPDANSEGVNQAAYRTPDYLLTSVQDYRAGQPGAGEHIWQATFGPGAVVFSTHPAWSSEQAAHPSTYWRGNGALPRVAQWKAALLAVYNLPEESSLGFTHAYFPTAVFDEFTLVDGWAFARKGNAFLAITTSQGIQLLERGMYARRELRSYGRQNVWFCQLGRAAIEGNFSAFQAKILSLDFDVGQNQVKCSTLSGDRLVFGWEGAFLVNQHEQPLSGYPHYENPYARVELPCQKMEILVGEDLLRLSFD